MATVSRRESIARNFIPLEERQRLVQTKGVTLNGQPAQIRGYLNAFATVSTTYGYHEWSWVTVKHVVDNKGGRFTA